MSKRDEVEALCRAHPDWNGIRIARNADCSPVYANVIINEIGLRAIGAMPEAYTVQIRRIGEKVLARIDSLGSRVAEGMSVMESREFALFIQQSGLQKLIAEAGGLNISKPVYELLEACQDRLRTNNTDPKFSKTQLATLQEQLEKLTSLVEQQSQRAA